MPHTSLNADARRIRQESLKRLGFKTYSRYLHSKLYRDIEKRTIADGKNKCCQCDRKAWRVLNRGFTMRDLLGESASQLFPLCFDCFKAAVDQIRNARSEDRKRTNRKLIRRLIEQQEIDARHFQNCPPQHLGLIPARAKSS
jgi:hypothetical protein